MATEIPFRARRNHWGDKGWLFEPWESRLKRMAVEGLPVYREKPPYGEEYDLQRGEEGTIRVIVLGDYEPAQRGGRSDPSWDAHYVGIEAWFHRPGKGWVSLDLDKGEEEAIETFLMGDGYCDGPDYDGPDDCYPGY